MARPDKATVKAFTSSGVPFQWVVDSYDEQGAWEDAYSVLLALVAWDDAAAWLRDMVGYTTWNGVNLYLQRVKPFECPLRPGFYCDTYQFVKMGAYPERESLWNEFDECFEQDWIAYRVRFKRPLYRVFSDETLVGSYEGKEQNRFCTFERSYNPRERRVSGSIFEYEKKDGTYAPIPDESAFIPDFQLHFTVGWMQVPVNAVPEDAIRNQLLTVNDAPFVVSTLGGTKEWPAQSLLFKGPMSGLRPVPGPDGVFYENLQYQFSYQPGGPYGWNGWLRPDLVGTPPQRDYGAIRRVRGNKSPPYSMSNFDLLFQPAVPT